MIGGVAATLHGSRIVTDDVDILVRTAPENIEQLSAFLAAAEARDSRRRSPAKVLADLAAGGTARLGTRYGDLDILGEVPAEGDLSFDALVSRAESIRIGRATIRVAALDDLIEMKTKAHRVKDLARLPELRRLAELKDHS